MRAILLLAVCCLFGALAAAERGIQVDEVRIEGCRNVHPDRIAFLTSVRKGATYDQPQDLTLALADDVRAIERMGPFTAPTGKLQYGADPQHVVVIFTVTELPYVTAVNWQGISEAGLMSPESDLTKKTETRPGGYANPLTLDNDLRAIERFFRDQGRRGTTARYELKEVPGGVELTFIVDLARVVKVGRIFYQGLPEGMRKHRFDELLERTQINRPDRPWQPEMLAIDRDDVPRTLSDEGWLDCRLERVEVEHADYVRPLEARRRNGPTFVPDGVYDDRVHLIYVIDAGERYRLGSVAFVGNTVASSEELQTAFTTVTGSWFAERGFQEGDWFRRQDFAKAVERARRVISNRGYAKCRVFADRIPDRATRTVNLVIRLDEGRIYHVGRIDVRGNEISRDSLIRRDIQVTPGQLWNDDDIDESKRQIQRSGLFKDDPRRPFAIHPEFPADRPDEADVAVELEEDRTASLNMQVGYSSLTGIFGSFGYTERNFDLIGALGNPFGRWRGGGQILDLGVTWAQQRNSVNVSWSEPSFADGPFGLSVSGARSDSTQRSWEEVRTSGSSGISRRFFSNNLRVGLTYGYADIDISNVNDDAPDDATEGPRFANTLGINASWDRLNNLRFPTSGIVLSASDSLSGVALPATNPVNEYQLGADGFLPFLESEDGGVTFLRLSTHWRQIQPVDGETQVPFYLRYFGGGPAPRHRGFAPNQLGPQAVNAKGFLGFIGGDRDFLATAEVSYPLQGLNDGIRAVVFVDVGNVWGEGETMDTADLRTAWGFGLRLPIQFPISLDFAWLVDPHSGESANQVHFGIGQMRF